MLVFRERYTSTLKQSISQKEAVRMSGFPVLFLSSCFELHVFLVLRWLLPLDCPAISLFP